MLVSISCSLRILAKQIPNSQSSMQASWRKISPLSKDLDGATPGTSINGQDWQLLGWPWHISWVVLVSCAPRVYSEVKFSRQLLMSPLVTGLSSSNGWLLPVYTSPVYRWSFHLLGGGVNSAALYGLVLIPAGVLIFCWCTVCQVKFVLFCFFPFWKPQMFSLLYHKENVFLIEPYD